MAGFSRRVVGTHLGVSHQAVSRAINSGRISTGADGKVISLEKAAAEWAENTQEGKLQIATQADKAAGLGNEQVQARGGTIKQPTEKPLADSLEGPADTPEGPGGLTYQKARTVVTALDAKLKQLDLDFRTGKLAQVDLVHRHLFSIAARVRENLMALPARLAPTFAAETDSHKIAQSLVTEITSALQEIADGGLDVSQLKNDE